MPSLPFPPQAAWRHGPAQVGFEVVFPRKTSDGFYFESHTSAVEHEQAWAVYGRLEVDASGATRRAQVSGSSDTGRREVTLEHDGAGHWTIDGVPAPELAGCLDVDLESSAFTNTLPVQRLALDVGERASAPAAYVRAADLRVERLEQTYLRLPDEGGRQRFDYESPAFGFRCLLVYDEHGLVLDYPGIAVRVV